jgi:hypothetical protein
MPPHAILAVLPCPDQCPEGGLLTPPLAITDLFALLLCCRSERPYTGLIRAKAIERDVYSGSMGSPSSYTGLIRAKAIESYAVHNV